MQQTSSYCITAQALSGLQNIIVMILLSIVNVLVRFIQAQRLLLTDGSLAHFPLPPNPTAMPSITAGLPAQVSKDIL